MCLFFQGRSNESYVSLPQRLSSVPILLLTFMVVMGSMGFVPEGLFSGADGAYADVGTGDFKDQIFWLTWENGDLTNGIHNNDSKTFTIPGGLEVTATFTNVTQQSNKFVPTDIDTWSGSISHDYYQNSTSSGEALYGGNGKTASFTLSFSSTLDGSAYSPHIVFLDPESTDGGESINVSTAGEDWEVVEVLGSGQVAYSFPSGGTCDIVNGSQGNPVLLSKYASSLDVYAKGGGRQGVSFGIWFGFDYGDAPNSYGTSESVGGPKHIVDRSTLLCIGSEVDAETDGPTGGTGSSDNSAGVDDEEGIVLPASFLLSTSYFLSKDDIFLTNQLSDTATLHAWIDFDQNGTFDPDEYASTLFPPNVLMDHPLTDLAWTGITGSQLGDTYARFRLTTDSTISGSTPGGLAFDGEVEDYVVEISDAALAEGGIILEGSWRKDKAMLRWILENKGEEGVFRVERFSFPQHRFFPIGKVDVAENKQGEGAYSFKDRPPLDQKTQKVFTYRIVRVDGFGNNTYSNSISLRPPPSTFTIAPNPTQDFLTISLGKMSQKSSKLIITNAAGQVFRSQTIDGKQLRPFTLSLAGWPKGKYMVQWISEQGSEGKVVLVK